MTVIMRAGAKMHLLRDRDLLADRDRPETVDYSPIADCALISDFQVPWHRNANAGIDMDIMPH